MRRIEISRGRKTDFSRVKREIPQGNRLAEISFLPQPVIRGLDVDQTRRNISGRREVIVKVIVRVVLFDWGTRPEVVGIS